VRVAGIIDRLVIGPDRVDIIDYKTNRLADQDRAALAAHYAPQLGAYRDALARLYPGRRLRCWLLWTDPVARDAPLQEVHP
jgi:ATP-dependent helicase/nuclease subunit A